MDNKKTVTVLAPNGRRQTVKVDPNTTILQILEEVCKKQGIEANDYDIKHHKKCLDTSTIIRFSGLPNNAQLELLEATKTRSEGTVILGLQQEDGTRLLGDFTPSDTLWVVLNQLCPEETNLENNPTIIYMRREVYGKANFENTTLRDLGLTSGRAMLRLIHRSPEELRTQANVSAPLLAKPTEEKPYIRTLKKNDDSSPESPMQQSFPKPVTPPPEPPINEPPELSYQEKETTETRKKDDPKQSNFITQFIKLEKEKTDLKKHATLESTTKQSNETEKTIAEEDFIFLGARNAMLFSQETAQAVPSEDLPDDFFELTITDAKRLLKDIKKRRLELENGSLQTATYRKMQESVKQLTDLNRYKQSIIRITFPDHTVLQGSFSPTDTVGTVLEFVRDYLEDKNMEFYLYAAPPKTILESNSRLFEAGCVPNAILHFGAEILTKNMTYLRRDLSSKFTTPSVASLAAAKMRQVSTRRSSATEDDDLVDMEVIEDSDVNVGASTSSAQPQQYEDYPDRVPQTSDGEKVPKWFRKNK